MKIESHLENLKESVIEIEDTIRKGNLIQKQRSLGFHSSAGAIDMLEIILHHFNLIDPGFVIKHEWFNSKRMIEEKFPFDFSRKKEILELIIAIESKRNILCYGKRESEQALESLVKSFSQLKNIFIEVTGYEL
jgi:hypothetical protein